MVRNSAVSILSQITKFCLQIGSIIILGRLLSPEDYGLIGMVQVVLVFIGLFGDLGLGAATIQEAEITEQQVSNLFWLNVLFGCFLGLITAALSPLVAGFYHEPRLIGIMCTLGLNFVIGGFAPQHEALLQRQMHFTQLSIIQILSLLNGIVAAVIAALLGLGYWSLVYLQLAMALTRSLGAWIACPWWPRPPQRGANIRAMLKFGSNVTGFYIFHYFSRNLDNILIGRFWGAQQLGFYSKSYQLLMLPIQQFTTPVTGVALPVLSRLRDQPETYATYYYKSILAISTLGMPIVALMFCAADKVIAVLLGNQWLDTVPIFRCLAPAAFLGLFMWTGWVYQSLDRTDRLLQWGIISSTVDVTAFLIGIHWGSMGVAIAFSLSQLLLLVPTFIHCYQGTTLTLRELATTLSRPAIASISAALIVMLVNEQYVNTLPVLLGLIVDCSFFASLYLGFWMLLPGGRQMLLEMVRLSRFLKPS